MSHHGSMAKELRHKAEQRLKNGELKVLVATASLELGIDIGDVDLVCQLGSPRSISAFLQRAGRARHQVGGVPKARLFPLSRDELVECAALLDAVKRGELDRLDDPAPAARRARAADRRRSRGRRLDRSGAVRSRAERVPLCGAHARRLHGRGAHAGRGLHHASRPWRRVYPPRRRQRCAARAPRRAPHRADLRRRDSGHRRLRRHPGADQPARGHGQRGLRRREPRGRHLPARQYVVQDPAHRSRACPRRGCPWPGADDSVLAGRGAGAQQRAVARSVAIARGSHRPDRRGGRQGGCDRLSRPQSLASHRRQRCSSSTISASRARRWVLCPRSRRSSSSGSSTNRAACSS